jgi:hypothetical protein
MMSCNYLKQERENIYRVIAVIGIYDIDPSRAPSLMVFVCARVVNE